MRRFIILLTLCALSVALLSSCKKEQKVVEEVAAPTPVEKVVYQPKHQTTTIELKGLKSYAYFNAPNSEAAKSVKVNYNDKKPYSAPIEVIYSYANGDTYKYVIPETFGLWENENGKTRVLVDKENTVWLQGQSKSGKFQEFVFYGDPKNNGKKIKPNSYIDNIKYSK